ncbi:MAG TPA: acyl-CoA dehydrogenase C-terminal domain-containing protein [Alphaproteobacteria bacterium]|nr:acyl-CoA dehydrogenase C-terminal domain-containing protein [Alphaproteobacteria bacterium]
MTVYSAPLDEMRFVLYDVLGAEPALAELDGHEEHGRDLIDAVLEEAAKLCEERLLPLNRSGDEEGCHYENGVVRTPKGFKEAYDTFVAGGWTGLACAAEDGGQDLPKVVNLLVEEMICSANLSFGTYPGLSLGAYNAITLHASEELKRLYLPKLASGLWSGTMCLTEPHCGTDLGLIRTRAEPQGDGSHAVTGTKIFISAGEHDLTRNIVHLVLARLPDAPAGTRGISLFLVPKFLPKPDGGEGPRNGVACGGIEAKMGIKASATCVLNFDGAKGWLIGEPNKGMRAMFTMMNAARLAVGIQGLGLAETAYQSARAYARERLQGRALSGAVAPEKFADPIIVHPDVRRLLLTIKANTEAARALALWVGLALDLSERHPDPERRSEADDLVQLMTPIVKAALTDLGFAAANHGLQVFGGHGYIREWGMEQLVRDARITQLYEGTNGIQALDLVGRKLPTGTGRLLRRFFHPAMALVEEHQADPELAELILPFAKALGRLQQATAWLAQAGLKDPTEGGAAASEYLRLFALTAFAYMWVRMAKAALARPDDAEFARTKLATARFFMARLLPESGALFQSLMSGAKPLMDIEATAF